jgi:Helix-turn-helix domain
MSGRQTQRARILALLIGAKGEWVGLPQILDLKISQYGARIHELRALGFDIRNKTETDSKIGVRRSWFRLAGMTAKPEPQKSPQKLEPACGKPHVTGLPLWDGVRQ